MTPSFHRQDGQVIRWPFKGRMLEVQGSLSLSEAKALFGHDVYNVGAYNTAIGPLVVTMCQLYGFDEQTASDWGAASLLHDIGKLLIPPAVLLHAGPLPERDRRLMQHHTSFGAYRLAGIWPLAAEMAATHHENCDGTGYPNRLRKSDIQISGRIVRICDVYAALRSPRLHKAPMSHSEALIRMLEGDDRIHPDMFDWDLLYIFSRHHRKFRDAFEQGLASSR